jgi:hypothetical protein
MEEQTIIPLVPEELDDEGDYVPRTDTTDPNNFSKEKTYYLQMSKDMKQVVENFRNKIHDEKDDLPSVWETRPKKYEEQLTELPPPDTDYDDFLHVKYDKMDEEDGESEIIFTVDKNSIKPNSIWNYIDKDGFITCMHTLCRINSKGHEYPRDINEEVKEQLEEQLKSHSGQNNYFVKDKSKSHVMFGYIYFYYFVIKMYDFNEEVVLVRYKKPYYNREGQVESPDVLSSPNV